MPIIEPDLSEVKDFQPWDPGVYAGKIVEVDFQTSKKSGNPMIVPNFEVRNNDGDTRKMKTWMVVTGEGAYNFESLLRAVGLHDVADRMRGGEKIAFDTDELIGLELNIQVEQEAYNGRMQNKVAGFLAA